jgi:hypothetical protein
MISFFSGCCPREQAKETFQHLSHDEQEKIIEGLAHEHRQDHQPAETIWIPMTERLFWKNCRAG